MGKEEVMKFVQKALPWIGAAATGNVPMLVTMAAGAVSDALGIEVEPTPTAISQAIAGATPEQIKALKDAENEFALKMRELNYKETSELYKSEVDDRNGARQREAEVKDHTNRNLAYLILLAFIAMVGGTLMGWTTADSVMAGTLIGYLSAKAEQVTSYYFGSTRGSSRKTELLASSTQSEK